MTNGDRIRKMSNEELSNFLFTWQFGAIFAYSSGSLDSVMDAGKMRDWMGAPAAPHPIFENQGE